MPIGANARANQRRTSAAELLAIQNTFGGGKQRPGQTNRSRGRDRRIADAAFDELSNFLNPSSGGSPTADGRGEQLVGMFQQTPLSEDLNIFLGAQDTARAGQDLVTEAKVPLGANRPGTTPLKVGGQGANAEIDLANESLQGLVDSGSRLRREARGQQGVNEQRQNRNTRLRNETLKFTIPFQSNQRRAIQLSNEVQTGRRRRRSGSTTIPLAAGLLTGRGRGRLL